MSYNKERTSEYIEKYDLRAVIATAPVNVSYFTGLDCWMYRGFRQNMMVPGSSNKLQQAYAVATPGRDVVLCLNTSTVLFASELEVGGIVTYGRVKEKIPRVPGLELFEEAASTASASPGEALGAVLRDLGVTKGRVGIEFANLTEDSLDYLKSKFDSIQLLDCTELIRLIRMVKTKRELERIRHASQVSEQAFIKSLGLAGEGVRMGELGSEYLREAATSGAVPDHYIYSPRGFGISSAPNYRLGKSEVVYVDCGCVSELYTADTGSTLIITGERGEGAREGDAPKTHRLIWETLESSLSCLVPGATPSSILATLSRAFRASGIEGVDYQGHGLGLEAWEHPIIYPGKSARIADQVVDISVEIPLEEGMVINLETPLTRYGKGSYQVERTFEVTKRKAREITPRRDGEAFVR